MMHRYKNVENALFTILGCDPGSSKLTTLPEKRHAFTAFIQVWGISDDYSGSFQKVVKGGQNFQVGFYEKSLLWSLKGISVIIEWLIVDIVIDCFTSFAACISSDKKNPKDFNNLFLFDFVLFLSF